MTDTQKAMEQALAWIEDAVVVLSHTSTAIHGGIGTEAEGVGGCSVAVVEALRSALAQQGEQQPYLHVYEYDSVQFGVHREFYPREWNGMKPTRTVPLYAAAPAAHQEARPADAEDMKVYKAISDSYFNKLKQASPAAVRKWAELTDSEIGEIADQCEDTGIGAVWPHEFYRKVNDVLREKNDH